MRLSVITRNDILFKSNYQDIEEIVFNKKNEDLNVKCDVGIVLGGISMIPYRVDEILKLYNYGLIERILLSGGIGFINMDRKITEASKMYYYLLDKGVPKNSIITETESRNTLENIKNTIALLETDYDLSLVKLALVTSDFHIKRSLELIARYVGRENLFASGVKDGLTDIDSWQNTLCEKKVVLKEALLLCRYARNNLINDLDIEGVSFSRKKRIR